MNLTGHKEAYVERLIGSRLRLIGRGLGGVDGICDVFVGVDGIDGIAHVGATAGVPHGTNRREREKGKTNAG